MDWISRLLTALFELHPLHSMTVHFPIALTATALFFVLLALWRRSSILEQIAFANLVLVIPGALAAGLTGMRDNLIRFDGAAPNAGVKIFLALSLIVLAGVTIYSRWRQRDILWQPNRVLLYLAGYAGSFALAASLGFLGGVILYGF